MKKELYMIAASTTVRWLCTSATILVFLGIILFGISILMGKDWNHQTTILTISIISAALGAIIKIYSLIRYLAERKQVDEQIEKILKSENEQCGDQASKDTTIVKRGSLV